VNSQVGRHPGRCAGGAGSSSLSQTGTVGEVYGISEGEDVRDRLHREESGLTLIELMVSMVLLSIILAAVASSLITFSRTTVDNERRVQATALMNQLHEQLQSIPWFDAAIYELEATAITGPDGIEDQLDGRDLVLIAGPSASACPVGDPDCNRRERVPEARFETVVDGNEYEVFQAVTWSDADEQTKRFTTVVRWSLLDRTYEERFESERVATAAEAGDPTLPRVIQFQVGPSPMGLTPVDVDPMDRNIGDISVVVRFSQPVDAAVLRFYSVGDPATDASGEVQLGQRTLSLTPRVFADNGKPIEFATTIAALAYRFPDGPRTFRAVGTLGAETFSGTTSMLFEDGSLPATADPDVEDGSGAPPAPEPPPEDDEELPEPPGTAVDVGEVKLSQSAVCMDNQERFKSSLRVFVSVSGMTVEDHDVSMTYTANGLSRTQSLTPVTPTSISPAGATFEHVFAAGVDHGFRPQPGDGPGNGNMTDDKTTFTVTAKRRSDGGSAGPVSSLIFTALKHPC
jgi:prepilin-type N-terminal cleavage/methylation domain-containing protein